MKAYGKSWGYNVYDCRYCLYRKGKLKGCVYPDGCCCPVPQKPARRNGIEQVYEAAADSAAPVSECEGCPYGRAAPCIGWCTKEVMTALGCADQKAGKLLHELESKCRLIERKRQGLGKPNLIYVKNFVDKVADNPVDNTSGSTTSSPESRFQNRENHDSGAVKITDQESLKSRSNNTDKNDTDSFPFTSFRRDHGRETKGNEAALREQYRELIAENIAYDALLTDYPYEQDTLEEILELLVDVVCTTKSSVRISGDDKPAEVVRSQFLKLNSEHIRFVVGGLKENAIRIRNMRQYLLATLYNAPLTIGNYYRSLVSHDMSEGFI